MKLRTTETAARTVYPSIFFIKQFARLKKLMHNSQNAAKLNKKATPGRVVETAGVKLRITSAARFIHHDEGGSVKSPFYFFISPDRHVLAPRKRTRGL